MPDAPPIRRLAVAAGLLVAVLVACGKEITGPASSPVNALRRVASFAFEPKYETAIPAHTLHAALQQVAFERVRITLRREDGTIALDTVVLFPVGADELTLTLNVPLPASTPASGVPLSLNLGYINAAGDTVFKGGPLPVTVLPSTGGTPPAPVQVPIHYTGPGATASAVAITPKLLSGFPGQTATFTAQAFGPTGQPLLGTPIAFTSSNDAVVTINAASGAATLVARGTAKVYAQLLTGPRDSAIVSVTLPASQLQLASGAGQTAAAGATLAQPVVARVTASDGVGVSGVTVAFGASGGGTVTPATAVSDASGNVSTQWKLGPTAGAQTLTVTSTGLTGSPLTVNATAQAITPTKLALQTGPVSGRVATALPAITVTAQDAAGNFVPTFTGDVTVTIGTNPGGAALSGPTTVTAVAGVATFSNLKLNKPGTGYTLAFSSSGLSGATSSTFDIVVGDAAKLAFLTPPGSVEAGDVLAPPVTVAAQDAEGNTVTAFTGAVTLAIGTNPGGATLTGTLARNAVAGIATFGDLMITKRGSPYTLTASATGLSSSTSAGFSVASGPPARLAIVSGNDQSAAAGTLLSAITVRLQDAFDNGIGGGTIAFAVTSGGGSLSSATATTDANGVASVNWTIGAGPQAMTATYAGLSPTTITATATGVSLVWTGATSPAWNTASNWSPAFAPTASDAVTIPVAAYAPIISAPASVLSLSLATGATLTNNSTLIINGSLDAGTTITGSGFIMLSGASGTLRGMINQLATLIGGTYTLAGTTQMTGSLTINGTGKLTVGGQSLTVTGNLSTSASGRLAMTNAADVVSVGGSTSFAGGSENGFLTAGTLTALGGFTASGSSFGATGTHTLKMASATTPQTLAFASPLAGQGINHLVFEGGAAKTLSGEPQIMGNVSLLATSGLVEGEVTVKIGGDFTDGTIFPDTLGGWRVTGTNFFGSNRVVNSAFITSDVTVSGTVQLSPCTTCITGDRFASLLADGGYTKVNGSVTVSGTGAVLKLNGNQLDVTGNFATASGGSLEMTDSNDYLSVAGSVTFGGGSTVGRLTAGRIDVMQDFTQSGAANSFAPSEGFYTYIGEPSFTELLVASRVRQARAIAPGVRPSAAVEAARSRRMQQLAVVRAERAERHAKLDRRAAAYASRGLAAPRRGQAASRGSAAASETVRLLRPRREFSGASTISFANPTSSFFAELYLSGPEFLLASDVLVKGELETGMSSSHAVASSSATPRKITSHGADVSDLSFSNVSWILLDGSPVGNMYAVAFSGMDPTADQFTIARAADENLSCEGVCPYELYYWSFGTTPTTGNYIKASDTNGGPNVLELQMVNPDPNAHGGFVSTAGGALISDWPETLVMTWLGTASTNWNDPANWSGGVVPTSSDDVLIPFGPSYQPSLNLGNGVAHNLTIESGMSIDGSCSTYKLIVYGNVVAPLGAPAFTTCEGDALTLRGDGTPGGNTVVGRFEVLMVEGAYKLPGTGTQVIADYELTIGSGGDLNVNGGRVDTENLYTVSGGTLTMTNALDRVFVVNDAAYFSGGSSTLTAGTLTITDAYLAASGSAFAPSGTHLTVLSGSNHLLFDNPAQSFLRNAQIPGGGTLYLDSSAVVTGTLSRGPGTGVITVETAVYPSPSRLLTVNGLNQSGADAMLFNNVRLNLIGTSAVTFNNAAFAGFGLGFMGDALFEVNRSSGSFTFTGLDFSPAGFGADTTRHYVKNTGNANITLSGAIPSSGISGTHFIATGVGTVTWP